MTNSPPSDDIRAVLDHTECVIAGPHGAAEFLELNPNTLRSRMESSTSKWNALMTPELRVKRIYDEPSEDDGFRILVDRLWPRGVSREAAAIDLWAKELTPSNELRKWSMPSRVGMKSLPQGT